MTKLSYAGRLFREFVGYAREKKSYWILPLIVILALASIMIATSQSVAPVLYTIF